MRSFHCARGLAALCLLAACGGVKNETFASEADLLHAAGDWSVVGSFDVSYPVKVVGQEDAKETLRFVHRNEPHYYNGWTGYTLRVLRVEGKNGEGAIVLRSGGGTPAAPR